MAFPAERALGGGFYGSIARKRANERLVKII